MQLAWIASLCFAVLIALFAVQNTTRVDVNLLAWRIDAVAVSTLVLAATAIGALLTYLIGLGGQLRRGAQLRGSRGTIRNQDALITELRARVRELERDLDRFGSPATPSATLPPGPAELTRRPPDPLPPDHAGEPAPRG